MSASDRPAERRQLTQHGQDRRADIVGEAERLFAERGYEKTRMTDLAERVGITKGLLYWYFDSKEALIAEIVIGLRRRLRDAQRTALEGIDDPLGCIYLGTVSSVAFIIDHYRLYSWSVLVPHPALGPLMLESGAVHAQDAAYVIAAGQASGSIRTDDSALQLAMVNAGVVDRICYLASAGLIEGGTHEAGHLAARYVVRSLAATDAIAGSVLGRHAQLTGAGAEPRVSRRGARSAGP